MTGAGVDPLEVCPRGTGDNTPPPRARACGCRAEEAQAELSAARELRQGPRLSTTGGPEEAMNRRRIALFGGSFDPPHRGHLAIAHAAATRFALDSVLFAPAGRQPLKLNGASASYAQRLSMVALACGTDPRFRACDLDAPHADGLPNFTIDLLHAVADAYPGTQLFSLAGADSFSTLGTWRGSQQLLARGGVDRGQPARLQDRRSRRAESLRRHSGYAFTRSTRCTKRWRRPDLRQRLARGERCDDPAAATSLRLHSAEWPLPGSSRIESLAQRPQPGTIGVRSSMPSTRKLPTAARRRRRVRRQEGGRHPHSRARSYRKRPDRLLPDLQRHQRPPERRHHR